MVIFPSEGVLSGVAEVLERGGGEAGFPGLPPQAGWRPGNHSGDNAFRFVQPRLRRAGYRLYCTRSSEGAAGIATGVVPPPPLNGCG